MTTKIKTELNPIQTPDAGPNLGGPTSNHLDEREKEFYRIFADRYTILNGGA